MEEPNVKVYVEPTGRRIQPFDDPIGETPIQNRPLSWWQDEAIRGAGLRRVERLEPPCLVLPDTFFATAATLQAFVDAAGGRESVFVLQRSRFGESSVPVQPDVELTDQGWRFTRVRLVTGAGGEPDDVLVDPLEKTFEVPAPAAYRGGKPLVFGIPRRPLMTLHHWVHLLWANQMIGAVEMRQVPVWRWVLRGLWAALKARSLNRWKILGKINQLGRGCDIHPTAVVEGCHLEDGVHVGPFARVAFSHLGKGAVVMPAAHVEYCVLGEQALVSEQCVVRFSVLYERAVASQLLMQQCVLGREALTTKGSACIDLSFDQDIKVALDGRLHSTGLRFLGSAFGHRCRVGTGFFMSPGRSIPNGYFLVRDPRTILSVIPPDLEGRPLNASGHRLRPLGLP